MSARRISLATLGLLSWCLLGTVAPRGQEPPSKNQAAPSQSPPQTQSRPETQAPFDLHDFHAKQVGLDCNACHVPEKTGSAVYLRPGPAQCTPCHQAALAKDLKQRAFGHRNPPFPPPPLEYM